MRVFVAAMTWFLVSLVAWWLGAKNYVVLGQGASFLALLRVYPNWKLGVTFIIAGLPFALAGFLNSLFWPTHSLRDIFLLSPSIGAIYGGALATGYAFFLCGTISAIWGWSVGYPSGSPSQSAP